jgi:hypothetical protein
LGDRLLNLESHQLLFHLYSKEITFENRIRTAAAHNAVSVVAFSWAEEHPFPRFRDSNPEAIPEIPVIAINRHSAEVILASGGLDADGIFEKWRTQGIFQPWLLISRLALRIDGKFERMSTGNFLYLFLTGFADLGASSKMPSYFCASP